MKRLQILIIILLISLSICALAIMPAQAQTNTLSQFVFNTISGPQTAGSAFTITITAKASNGNTVTSYTGTNTLTVSSGTIAPTTTTPFVAGVWTGQVTLSQAGTGLSISTIGGGKSGTSNKINVNPGALNRFVFNTIGSPQTAGKVFSIAIIAKDVNGNTVTSYTGTNTLTPSLGTISQTSTSAFVAGVWTGSVSLSATSSSMTLVTSGSSKSGTSNSFTVNAGALDHFVFNNIGTQTVGTAFSITLTAKDLTGNTVTSYTGTNKLSVSLGTISPTNTGKFSSGIWTGSVTLSSAGSAITIGTSETSKFGVSNSFTVNSLALDHFVFNTVSSPQTAGSPFSITVTAKSSNGNTITTYSGRPTLSVSSGTISPAVTGAFSNGVWMGTVTVTGADSGVTIMAKDGSHSGISNSFKVNSAVANRLAVSSGVSNFAGVAFSVTVTARDGYGNTATGYTGRVHFSSSDSASGVILPSDYRFLSGDLGTHTFTDGVTLKTVGANVSITVTDTATGAITGSQTGITVTRAAVANVVISPSGSSVTAEASKTFLATASDAYGNNWDVTSLTSWSVSSGAGGSWSNNVFISATAGIWTVTGTYASIPYTTNLTVNPADLDHFIFNTIASQSAGSTFNLTITAKDASNNTVTSYTGRPFLTYSAGAISPIAMDNFVSGVGSTFVTVNSAGSNVTIKATDSTHSGTSNIFTVNPIIFASAGEGGTINPAGNVSIDYGGFQSFNITADTGYSIVDVVANNVSLGAVSSYTITGVQTSSAISAIFAPIPTPSPSPSPTTTQPPSPTIIQTPQPSPTPYPTGTPNPTPTPIPSSTIVPATTPIGATIELEITGNITSQQISNATITSDQQSKTTTLAFTVTGPNGTEGLGNMTIPKSAIPYGTTPVIYIDGQLAPNQGYTQDSNNFYVWYTTEFSTHQMKIQFMDPSTILATPFGSLFAVAITVPEIILIYTVIAVRRLRRKPENT